MHSCQQNPSGLLPLDIAAADIAGAKLPAPVYVYNRVSSTLDMARELGAAQEGAPWTSIVAASQSGGRGQLRRHWQSPAGNIYAALCLPRESPFSEMACAPAVGYLVVQALRQMGLDVYLKWPNDIVQWQAQEAYKVGGILVEESRCGIWAGIGLNMQYSPPQAHLRPDHALKAATLDFNLASLESSEEFHNIIKFWLQLVKASFSCYETRVFTQDRWCAAATDVLLWQGRMVNLYDETMNVRARLLGISSSGGICLERQGRVEEFFSGSLRLCHAGYAD